MAKFFCKYCGQSFSSISSLTANKCGRHPDGTFAGRHALYQGDEKPRYSCEFCGYSSSSISSLTANKCPRHPDGHYAGRHSPAL